MPFTLILSQLKQRLYKTFQRRHTPPKLGHLMVPPEIILIIAKELDKVSLIALGLTCHTLYHLCLSQRPQGMLSGTEKVELLQLLVKDLSRKLYFCHFCVKLHDWYGSSSSRLPREYQFNSYFDGCPRWIYAWTPRMVAGHGLELLRFNRAHLVMNRHFYGWKHGKDIRKLYPLLSKWHIVDSRGISITSTRRARIVDDQLLMASSRTIFHTNGDSDALSSYILNGFSRMYVCYHISAADVGTRHDLRSAYDRRSRIPELARHSSTKPYFAPYRRSVGSCLVCMTDYCIDITYCNSKKGWVISLETYTQLGPCRSPHDWSWVNFTLECELLSDDTAQHRSTLYSVEHRPGMIRRRWSKKDAVVLQPEGRWVGRDEFVTKLSAQSN